MASSASWPSVNWVGGGVGMLDMGVEEQEGLSAWKGRPGSGRRNFDILLWMRTAKLWPFLLEATMRCSGASSGKCTCTLFRGGRQAKICKSCHHHRTSHYELSDSDSTSGDHSDSDNNTGYDSDSNNDNRTKQESGHRKNKMTVSSLVTDLLNTGESSQAEVKNARREAKAGLTKKQVS